MGTTFAVSLTLSPIANAAENPFSMTELSQGGYMVAAAHGGGEGKCGEDKEGEGHCGEDKEGEGKCGEGKCGRRQVRAKTRTAKAIVVRIRKVRASAAKASVVKTRKAKVNAAKASAVRTSRDNLHLSPDLSRSSAFQAHVSAVFG